MVGVHLAFHRINIFLLRESECAATLGVLSHQHDRTQKKAMHGKTIIFPTCGIPKIVVYQRSSPQFTTLTHVGPDLAGHQ